jgi:uncharacterized protein YecE (DUF72 family)
MAKAAIKHNFAYHDDLPERAAPPPPPAIRVGIGGWTFTSWRGNFYPEGLPQRRELEYASRKLTAIEINGTFYSLQKPETFARWREETPDGFMFALKAPKFLTHSRVLSRSPGAADDFIDGVLNLGDRLGPLLWQFAPSKRFDAEELERFIELLPRRAGGRALRHVIEVRHPSFACPAFVEIARRQQVAIAYSDSSEYPSFADVTADFVYARLQRTSLDQQAGYPPEQLGAWAQRLRTWAAGGEPLDLPRLTPGRPPKQPRDVFAFFINAAKVRNPAAAQALIARLK